MQAVLLGKAASGHFARLKGKLTTPWRLARFDRPEPADSLAAALAGADAVIATSWGDKMPPAPRLRLLQVPGAGFEHVNFAAVPGQATICNAYGHAEGMAEYVLLAMLQWQHRFAEMHRAFRRGSWKHGAAAFGPLHGEVFGSTVGIVGLGRIGQAVAVRAKAFGMTVIAANRTPIAAPAGVDRLVGLDRLVELAGECDFLVVTLAQAADTTGLIGGEVLAAMKPTGVVINVGRGPVIAEDALYAALHEKRIGGAVIDVWYRYPSASDPAVRPSKHPFHELPNCYMTPHASGWTLGQAERRWSEIAINLDRLATGGALLNVIRPPSAKK
jgi:phosphoglycerate dehydrogenase-like enzyme